MPRSRRYRVLTLGHIAAGTLLYPGIGEVEGVFHSTFYIRLRSQMICLGPANLTPGPINCAVAVPDAIDWQSCGLVRKAPVRVSANTILIDGYIHFDCDYESVWKAPAPATKLFVESIYSGAGTFRESAAERNDTDGFGYFSRKPGLSPVSDHTSRVAEEPLALACKWLEMNLGRTGPVKGNELDWVSALAGLGMGLTPSGDDFLGGMMIALTRLDEKFLRQRLWNSVRYWANKNSNPISLAHLSAAAEGYGNQIIHNMVTAILHGDINAINTTIDDIATIGHSSGWDIMLGVILTIETWLTLQTDRQSRPA